MLVQNTEGNSIKCVCASCPSYNACMSGGAELLYCGRSKSGCQIPKNGCICGGCPVHSENHLESGYYCVSGQGK